MFVSSHYSLLTRIIEIFNFLIFPFTWRYTKIPFVPSSTVGSIQSSGKYIVGIHSSYLPDITIQPDDTIFVNLDENEVKEGKFKLPSFNRTQLSVLEEKLRNVVGNIFTHPDPALKKADIAFSEYDLSPIASLLYIEGEEEAEEKEKKQMVKPGDKKQGPKSPTENNQIDFDSDGQLNRLTPRELGKVREYFIKFWAVLLKDYRRSVTERTRKETECKHKWTPACSRFLLKIKHNHSDKDCKGDAQVCSDCKAQQIIGDERLKVDIEFMKDRAEKNRHLLEAVLETRMWHSFLKDASKENLGYIRRFDESIKKLRLKRKSRMNPPPPPPVEHELGSSSSGKFLYIVESEAQTGPRLHPAQSESILPSQAAKPGEEKYPVPGEVIVVETAELVGVHVPQTTAKSPHATRYVLTRRFKERQQNQKIGSKKAAKSMEKKINIEQKTNSNTPEHSFTIGLTPSTSTSSISTNTQERIVDKILTSWREEKFELYNDTEIEVAKNYLNSIDSLERKSEVTEKLKMLQQADERRKNLFRDTSASSPDFHGIPGTEVREN